MGNPPDNLNRAAARSILQAPLFHRMFQNATSVRDARGGATAGLFSRRPPSTERCARSVPSTENAGKKVRQGRLGVHPGRKERFETFYEQAAACEMFQPARPLRSPFLDFWARSMRRSEPENPRPRSVKTAPKKAKRGNPPEDLDWPRNRQTQSPADVLLSDLPGTPRDAHSARCTQGATAAQTAETSQRTSHTTNAQQHDGHGDARQRARHRGQIPRQRRTRRDRENDTGRRMQTQMQHGDNDHRTERATWKTAEARESGDN